MPAKRVSSVCNFAVPAQQGQQQQQQQVRHVTSEGDSAGLFQQSTVVLLHQVECSKPACSRVRPAEKQQQQQEQDEDATSSVDACSHET